MLKVMPTIQWQSLTQNSDDMNFEVPLHMLEKRQLPDNL